MQNDNGDDAGYKAGAGHSPLGEPLSMGVMYQGQKFSYNF